MFSQLISVVFMLFVIAGCSSDEEVEPSDDALANGQTQSNRAVEPFSDIPVGFTEDGYPYRGDPNAPVTAYEYSDYLCPFCGRHTNETMPILLEQFARTGKVKFVFRDYPIEALHPTADIGHLASICVAEQSPNLFWKMHDQLFARQHQWSGMPDPTAFVVNLAEEVGADMSVFEDCFTDNETFDRLNVSVAEAKEHGFNGTPSFHFQYEDKDELHPYVGAQPASEFTRIFNTLAASGELPVEPTPEPPQLPYWLTAEGLAVDPLREGYTMAGDYSKGNPDADLVVVELSDFQCPSCATHSLEIQPMIDEQLIITDQVRWVMKNLPVSEHKRAPIAAAASECAGEQNRFWQMKERLYESQESWVNSEEDAVFNEIALEIGLNVDQFSSCLMGRSALERVFDDLFDAHEAGIFRTPSFIIVYNEEATLLEGSREGSVFVGMLENALNQISE